MILREPQDADDEPPAPPGMPVMFDVRALARAVKMQPVDLVRELVADGIDVAQVSRRGYRVTEEAWATWLELRRKRCAEEFRQGTRRSEYVRGGDEQSKRRPSFRR